MTCSRPHNELQTGFKPRHSGLEPTLNHSHLFSKTIHLLPASQWPLFVTDCVKVTIGDAYEFGPQFRGLWTERKQNGAGGGSCLGKARQTVREATLTVRPVEHSAFSVWSTARLPCSPPSAYVALPGPLTLGRESPLPLEGCGSASGSEGQLGGSKGEECGFRGDGHLLCVPFIGLLLRGLN